MKSGDINWNKVPLGLISDRELARRIGCSYRAVRYARVSRGIAPCADRVQRGIAWDDVPLGEFSDGVFARLFGVCRQTVFHARLVRGIPAHKPTPPPTE